MNKSITSFDTDIISANLYHAIFQLNRNKDVQPLMGVKSIYFCGATLCMDYKGDVIIINHSTEDSGYLSGGFRRLLSIKCMRLLEALLDICEVKHTQKWVTKRIVNS